MQESDAAQYTKENQDASYGDACDGRCHGWCGVGL